MKMNLPFLFANNEVDGLKTLTVALPHDPYDILIGPGALAEAGPRVAALAGSGVMVVSDETVWNLHGPALRQALAGAGVPFDTVVVPAGEASKSLACLHRLYESFAGAGLARDGLVLAFGGGVVGDLAGYAAATWMRGVRYVQIPTTLLAQVDSSVGGKTAVDLPSGKNLVGAFHQPRLVLADTALLDTLPPRELACGMGEVVKYGAIADAAFFARLAGPDTAPSMEEIVHTCCAIKAGIVARDERDNGERKLLNFGHTLGHAVETLGGYARFGHGQAVAVGMVLAARMGEKLGFTPAGCADALCQTLARWDLPTESPYPPEALMPHVTLDKKRRGDGVDMVMLRDIGQAEVVCLALADVEKLLREVAP